MGTIDVRDWLDAFIDRQVKYRSLKPQFTIAIIAGIAFALDQGVLYYLFFNTDAREFYGPLIVMIMISYTMAPLVLWWCVTAVSFLFGRSLGAHMTFGIMYRTFGWGMIPMVGSSLSLTVGRFLALRSNTTPCAEEFIICDPRIPNSFTDQVEAIFLFLGLATAEPIFQIFYAIGAILFFVTVYLWIVGTEATSTLTKAGATVVVGLPSLVAFLVFTISVF